MKYILFILLLLTGVEGYSQSSTIGYIPKTGTVVLCTDNLNLTTEYSPFGMYTMSEVLSQSDYRYRIPNTWGFNVGLFQNGLNIGGGGTIIWLPNDDYEIIPNVLVRFHPIKMITQDNRRMDISFMLNISREVNFGIGISFNRLLNAF